jgi:hypothetical protein
MKEPKILQMDWKALGYERLYIDGKLRWIPALNNNLTYSESQDS